MASLYDRVASHLKKNPEMDYKTFQKKAGIKIRDSLFYNYRKRFQERLSKPEETPKRNYNRRNKRAIVRTKKMIEDYFQKNPNGTRAEFMRLNNVKVPSSTFSNYQKKTKAVTETFNSIQTIKTYKILVDFPAGILTTLAKTKIKEFVNILNQRGMGLEIVEYTEPRRVVEIRQIG